MCAGGSTVAFGATGGFTFKAATSSTSAAPSNFKFGVTTTSATAATTCSANAVPAFPAVSGGYKFGQASDSAPSNVVKSPTQGAGGFQLSQSAVTAVSSSSSVSLTQPAFGSFQFGKSPASSAANESGQSATGASVTSSAPSAASSSTALSSGGFSFGSSKITQSVTKASDTANFTFGQRANASEIKTSAVFSFGSQTTNNTLPSLVTSPGKPEVAVITNLFKAGGQSSVRDPSNVPVQTSTASAPVAGSVTTSAGSGQTSGQFAGFGFSCMSTSAATLTSSFSSSVSNVSTALKSAEGVGVTSVSLNAGIKSNLGITTPASSASLQPSSAFMFGQVSAAGFQTALGAPAVTTGGFQFGSSLPTAGMLNSLNRNPFHFLWFSAYVRGMNPWHLLGLFAFSGVAFLNGCT